MVTVFSDYIFILYTRQEQKQPSPKNSNEFIIAENNSVLTYLEQALDIYICDDKDALFEYRFTCKIKDFAYPVTFTINIVSDCTYLRISLDTQTTYQAIRVIEYIQDMITNSGIENEYVMIISYDSISEYYCNKAYPKLNRQNETCVIYC